MKPRILAKSAVTVEQMTVKENIGCDGIELQLLEELVVNRSAGSFKKWTDIYSISDFSGHDIRVVHMPLLKGDSDFLLETMMITTDFYLLCEVVELAQAIAKQQRHTVGVVIHSESCYGKLVDEQIYDKVVDRFYGLLEAYPDVEFYIENVSPLRGSSSGELVHFSNNFAFDNVELVKHLREDLKSRRLYTCLDTCHAMLAEKYVNAIYACAPDLGKVDLCLERYFAENQEICGLIHLADARGCGYGRGKHGISFTPETADTLYEILNAYNKYKYTCPITLEVAEDNYSVCDGYKQTKDLVNTFYQIQN